MFIIIEIFSSHYRARFEIDEHVSFVSFTLQNFVADCGGLIGLFLGFSLLTIFELTFDFVANFFTKLKSNRIDSAVVIKRDKSKCCKHCE